MLRPTLMYFLPLAALALPAAAQEAPSPQGMVVVRDAETGQLRAPTSTEARALHPRTNASAAKSAASAPRMVTGPRGSRSVKLGEQHLVYSVVTRGADGQLAEQCVHGAQAAEHAVQGASHASHAHPAATQPEEHSHESR